MVYFTIENQKAEFATIMGYFVKDESNQDTIFWSFFHGKLQLPEKLMQLYLTLITTTPVFLTFKSRVNRHLLTPFDRIWYSGLFHKLKSYGISGQIFGLISSFLSNGRL